MSNVFPQKELKQQKRYLLATDCYDSTSQALIVYDLDTRYIVESRGFCNEDKFEEEVKRLSEYYNTIKIEDLPTKAIDRKYGAVIEPLKERVKSENFKNLMIKYFKDWLEKDDIINNVRVIK